MVDDHSPDGENYPQAIQSLRKRNVEYVYAPKHGGAGYARNIGLEQARGKWLVFADADDLFSPDAFTIFDKYRDSSKDIIYFRTRQVLSEDLSARSSRLPVLDELFLINDEREFRLRHIFPWGKMIKADLIKTNGFTFEEVLFGNDIVFGTKIGCSADAVQICDELVYYLTERKDSLTSSLDKNEVELECRLKENIKALRVARESGYEKNNSGVAYRLEQLWWLDKAGFKRCKLFASEQGVSWPSLLIKGFAMRIKEILRGKS